MQINPAAFESVSLINGAIGIVLTGIFGYLIELTYRSSSNSSSGGRQLISTLMPLSLCICLIITVVKGSLALSLGLVGALSIVRFRTPIKDPEDLLYLFLSIVSGLGFGSGQSLYTSVGILSICLFLLIRARSGNRNSRSFDNTHDLTIQLIWPASIGLTIENAVDHLSIHCSKVNLLRFNSNHNSCQLQLQINIDSRKSSASKLVASAMSFHPESEIIISNSSLIW